MEASEETCCLATQVKDLKIAQATCQNEFSCNELAGAGP